MGMVRSYVKGQCVTTTTTISVLPFPIFPRNVLTQHDSDNQTNAWGSYQVKGQCVTATVIPVCPQFIT